MQRKVSFEEAIKKCFDNYATFNGRASRSEYWFWYLFTVLVGIVMGIISFIIGSDIPADIVSLALLLPGLAVAVRRLHDVGKAGGWIFIALVPIVGWILLIVWYCTPSEPVENRFGEVPNMEY